MMLSKDLSLSSLGLVVGGEAAIEDINFNIDTKLTRDSEFYAILRGRDSHLYDIIRLVPIGAYSKTHTMYRIVPDSKIRLSNEMVGLRIMRLDKSGDTFQESNRLLLKLKTDQYALSRQAAIAQEVHTAVRGYFEQIVEMYNEIKKGDTSDDYKDQREESGIL